MNIHNGGSVWNDDINLRMYGVVTLSGYWWVCYPSGDEEFPFYKDGYTAINSATFTNPSTFVDNRRVSYQLYEPQGDCGGVQYFTSGYEFGITDRGCRSLYGSTCTATETTLSTIGGSAGSSSSWSSFMGSLSGPIGVTDVFTGSAGSACTTEFTSWALSSTSLYDTYIFSGVSVAAAITMSGVIIGTDYELTMELSRYNTGTTATDTVYDVVTVTAEVTGIDTYDYHVPIIEGYEYTFVGITIAAA